MSELDEAQKIITTQDEEIKELKKENSYYRKEIITNFSDLKELIDHYKTLDKDELIEKFSLKNARMLSQDKEIDRLNEYIQILELQR